jgi:hypothetical protein
MKKIHFIGIMLLVLFVLPGYNIINAKADTEASKEVKAYYLGVDEKITIDGDASDWAKVDPEHFELRDPIDSTDTVTYEAKLRIAYDDNDIYFLVEIEEKYQFESSNEQEEANGGEAEHGRQNVAIGLAFSINGTDSSRHMGSESSTSPTSVGFADIMHWEVETDPGVVNTGSNGIEGRMDEGSSNLDDMYSSATYGGSRSEDKIDQAWTGAWDHTNKVDGALGTYIFELKRPLTNNDDLDAQFEIGKRNEITIAFWTPFETINGWTPSGHYTSSHIEGYFVLGSLPSTPIVEILIGLLTIVVAIPIISKFVLPKISGSKTKH